VLRGLRVLTTPAMTARRPSVVLIGAESAGKTTLAAALAGRHGRSSNVAGATTTVEAFEGEGLTWIDTPGLVRTVDAQTTSTTLAALDRERHGAILVVIRATELDADLAALLPLAAGRRVVIAVTQWDRVDEQAGPAALRTMQEHLDVPVVALDARRRGSDLDALRAAIDTARHLPQAPAVPRIGWRVVPRAGPLERRFLGPLLALALLFGSAATVVGAAVGFAGWLDPLVAGALRPLAGAAGRLPELPAALVAGDFGLLTMGPLLVVWAAPVVFSLAGLLAVLRSSGLLDRLTRAVDPLLRPVGLSGRDLVRVVAGFGCNVPAVISTRSCATCSRDASVGAIAFGSACSFQLGATAAVLATVGRTWLLGLYLAALLAGTLVHTRVLSRGERRAGLDVRLLEGPAFLNPPRLADVVGELRGVTRHVGLRALPVFVTISIAASALQATGLLDRLAGLASPLLSLLRLPGEAALPVVLASIRKDGLLLFADTGVADTLDSAQLLAALLLAGTLLPCLVTAATIVRERGGRTATRLIAHQIVLALGLTATVSWFGAAVLP
jgi:Fe2+ transport system protein B